MSQLLEAHAQRPAREVELMLSKIRQNPDRTEFYVLSFVLTTSSVGLKALTDKLEGIPDRVLDWATDIRTLNVASLQRSAITNLADALQDAAESGASSQQKRKAENDLSEFVTRSDEYDVQLLFDILKSTPELWNIYYKFFPHAPKVDEAERAQIQQALLSLSIDNEAHAISPYATVMRSLCHHLTPRARQLFLDILDFQEMQTYGDAFGACK